MYPIRAYDVCPAIVSGSVRSEQVKTVHQSAQGTTSDSSETEVDSWALSFPVDATGGAADKATWTGRYDRHDISVTAVTGPCTGGGGSTVLATMDATGGGGGQTPMQLFPIGAGSYG